MILLTKNSNVNYLVGGTSISTQPRVPFDEMVCGFLNDLSTDLRSNKKAKLYPDIITFAFWCRKANISRLKKDFLDGKVRLGLGLAFHITPSNVPINFAFSFVFGMLSGNANIVRIPSKLFPQVEIICSAIDKLFRLKKYQNLMEMNIFLRYDQNSEITSKLSENANARIVWGGDSTIKAIKNIPAQERTIDLTFADRYSICIIKSNELLKLDKKKLNIIGKGFFNDTYLMDQNACSSPQLIIWLGKKNTIAKEIFWSTIFKIAKKEYNLKTISVLDKYTQICNDSLDLEEIGNFKNYSNLLYTVSLSRLPKNILTLRGNCGYFYEYNITDLNSLTNIVSCKFQTLTYFGLNKPDIINFIVKNRLSGIDRVVPIGKALDIGVFWDGYDILGSLTRIIDVE